MRLPSRPALPQPVRADALIPSARLIYRFASSLSPTSSPARASARAPSESALAARVDPASFLALVSTVQASRVRRMRSTSAPSSRSRCSGQCTSARAFAARALIAYLVRMCWQLTRGCCAVCLHRPAIDATVYDTLLISDGSTLSDFTSINATL